MAVNQDSINDQTRDAKDLAQPLLQVYNDFYNLQYRFTEKSSSNGSDSNNSEEISITEFSEPPSNKKYYLAYF